MREDGTTTRCGVTAINTTRQITNDCLAIDDFYNSDLFECVLCPNDILTHEFFRTVGITFRNVCEMIAEFLESELPIVDFGELAYAFLVCKDGNIRGACGYEDVSAGDSMRFKLYINPLAMNQTDEKLQIFTRILNIAIHEVSHIVLHSVNPEIYHVSHNKHCPEFFEIFALIDEYFYDRVKFMELTWV